MAVFSQYNGPESVEHDPVGQRYFVSNTESNSILQRSYGGTVSVFKGSLPGAPYGLELKGDTLFACMGGAVRGYDTSDGEEVFNLGFGASFLNGITTDGTFLYVTDFSAKKILKVDVAQQSFTTLVAQTGTTPNGIVWDEAMDRLWVVNWGSNAKIKAYDRNTGAELSSFTTALANLDGITLDCQGRIIVSSWSPARISRFGTTFSNPPVDLAVPGLSNPADLDYDTVNDRICVPNSGNNTVVFAEVMDCTAGFTNPSGGDSFSLHPNPSDGFLAVDPPVHSPVPFLILNVRGALVASGTLRPNGLLDIAALAPGMYMLELPSLRKRAKFVRR